jgi:cell wall-associated NlpC family hydrolase
MVAAVGSTSATAAPGNGPSSAPSVAPSLSRSALQVAFGEAAVAEALRRDTLAEVSATAEDAATTETEQGGEDGAPVESSADGAAQAAVAAALTRVGSSYVRGGEGPATFDCSGLTMWAYRSAGVSLPHYSGAQMSAGTPVSIGAMRPGDLMFFGSGGSRHVAMYIGDGEVVHATNPRRGVVTGTYQWEMDRGDFAGVRRYV